MQFTAVFMQVSEGYIAFVEELPSATKDCSDAHNTGREKRIGFRDSID
jgi:hypothetical protein